MERRKEQNRQAALRYVEKNKDDPAFVERRREANRKSMNKRYHEKRAAMTEEELAIEREKQRIRMKVYREKKKAEKLAAQAANLEKKGTD